MSRKNTVAQFEANYIPEPNSGCWLWLASARNGRYGSMNWSGKPVLGHVLAYRLYRGEVPTGKVLDHKCRNTFCVNPNHLEVVTQRINMERSAPATKEHCKHGHAYVDGVETYDKNGRKYRRCLTCYRIRYKGATK